MHKKTSFLDGLRGIAAIYVLAGHARWLLWEGYNEGYKTHPEAYSVIDKTFMYLPSFFKWGHESVLLFFVLSGYVIHLGYASRLKQNPQSAFNFSQYFYKRIKRIYPPFLLALLITLSLDTIGKHYNFPIYYKTPYSIINSNISNGDYKFTTFIGNIFFLYEEHVPLFGTNGPAWSLKLEWWFYLFYPIFLLFARKHIYYSTLLIILLFGASFFPILWPDQLLRIVFASMVCWWVGVILAEISSTRIIFKLSNFSKLCFLMFLTLFFLNKNAIIYDLQMAFLFGSVLSFLIWCDINGKSLKLLDRLKPLGDFSYTLYITHFPILVFLSGIVMKLNHNSLPMHSYFILISMIFCLLIAYLLHFLVEVPFLNLNKPVVKEEG